MSKKISDLDAVVTPAATDLFELEDASGDSYKVASTDLFRNMPNSLILSSGSSAYYSTSQTSYFGYKNGTPNNMFQSANAAHVVLEIEAASSQTANLLEINSNGGSGGDLFKISSAGAFTANSSAQFSDFRFVSDTDTGISRDGTNILAIDAGGSAAAQFDADATAGNTRFLIYDVDNATLERVSVGAADSGGSGYKVLRIAN